MADETGSFVRGDLVGTITAAHLGAAAVVTPVTSNSAIEATGLFSRVTRTRVGSPYVIEAMKTSPVASLVIGFEANGGVMLGGEVAGLAPLPTRDAFLPILSVLAYRQTMGRPLSELAGSLGFRNLAADRLQNADMPRANAFLRRLIEDRAFASELLSPLGGIAEIDQLDGVRMTAANGNIVHFRASGNAPEVRCYVEAASENDAQDLLSWSLTILADNTTQTC